MGVRRLAGRDAPAIAEINIIPLCDVLLVLLIIFMVTAPALSYQIDLDLPQQGREPAPPTSPIDLRIDAAGAVSWNGEPVGRPALESHMQAAADVAEGRPLPLLRIAADGDCDYQAVAQVLAAARNAGLDNIGFVRQ